VRTPRAVHGAGVVLVPDFLVKAELERGDLLRLLPGRAHRPTQGGKSSGVSQDGLKRGKFVSSDLGKSPNLSGAALMAKKAFHKLTCFDEVDEGGHFVAWEEPQLLAAEVRAVSRMVG